MPHETAFYKTMRAFFDNNDLPGLKAFLVKQPELVNVADKNNNTLLHTFVAAGRMDFCKALLHRDADVNVLDSERASPLILAAKIGRADILEELLKCGAKLEQEDAFGRSALFYSKKGGHQACRDILVDRGAIFVD